tara:strand:- start:3671 stop:4786 length:1116 start_codon:yes stop_codon:yes gene_type:complete
MLDFKGGAASSLKEEFDERIRYRIETEKYKQYMIDTLYEDPHYGFLNRDFEPIITNVGDQFENLQNFEDLSLPAQRALPFVVKAFKGFREQFMNRTRADNFSVPMLLGAVVPIKSYQSYDDLYREYLDNMISQYKVNSGNYARYRKNVLIEDLIKTIKVFPITQSGFVLSRHCPISTTGLSLELAELSYSTDQDKGIIMDSDSYLCLLKDAKKWGFYVDRNNPWRLICNLNSPYTSNNLQQYKPGVDNEYILSRFFRRKTQYEDIQSVFKVFQSFEINNLTNEELLDYTVLIRMAETNMDPNMYGKITQEVNDIYKLYSNNYPADPYKGSSAILGKYCSMRLKEMHSNRSRGTQLSPTSSPIQSSGQQGYT